MFIAFAVIFSLVNSDCDVVSHPVLAQISNISDPNMIINYGIALSTQFPDLGCKIVDSIVEVSVLVRMLVESKTDSVISDKLTKTRHLFTEDFSFLYSHSYLTVSLLTAFKALSNILLSKFSEIKVACSVSFRYKSSTITAIESGDWNTPNLFFPIGNRIRDILITRDRCIEESLISIISITRSVSLLSPSPELFDLIQSIISKKIGFERIFFLRKVPIIDALYGLFVSLSDTPTVAVYYYPPRSISKSVWQQQKSSRRSPLDIFNEIEHVILRFKNSTGDYKNLKNEHLFLQSINANWLPYLANNTHGYRLCDALVQMSSHPSYVNPPSMASSLSGLLTASNEIDISTLLAGFNYRLVESVAHLSAIRKDVVTEDVSIIMEMEWQTIAGEKLLDLISTSHTLFQYMKAYWKILSL
jgi:hypothetical protein